MYPNKLKKLFKKAIFKYARHGLNRDTFLVNCVMIPSFKAQWVTIHGLNVSRKAYRDTFPLMSNVGFLSFKSWHDLKQPWHNLTSFIFFSFSCFFLLFKLACELQNTMNLHQKLRDDKMSSQPRLKPFLVLKEFTCKINNRQ